MNRYFSSLLLLFLLTSCVIRKIIPKTYKDSIIEQKSIGKYSLQMTKDELDTFNAKIETLHIYTIYTLLNVKIWYNNKKNRTDQICVSNSYQGKFRDEIGINDYLTKLSKISKYYWDNDDEVFLLKSIKGICFNVYDEHSELEESQKQIDHICIYRE